MRSKKLHTLTKVQSRFGNENVTEVNSDRRHDPGFQPLVEEHTLSIHFGCAKREDMEARKLSIQEQMNNNLGRKIIIKAEGNNGR